MPRPTTALLRAGLLLGLAMLVACGGQTSPAAQDMRPRPAAMVKGTCWDAQQLGTAMGRDFAGWVGKYAAGDAARGQAMRDDAAFTTQIDCSDPHAIELYNVVGLDPALASRITSYADLLDHGTALFRRIRSEVNERCAAGSAYSVAEQEAHVPLQLGPSLREGSGLRLAWDPFPPDRWAKGEHQFVCTFQQQSPGTVRFAEVTTKRLPVGARVCLDAPGRQVPCDGPHRAEDIAEMILNTAIERGMLDARKAVRTGAKGRYVALSADEYARLDRVCQSLLDMVTSRSGDYVARAYPGSAAQWPTPGGAYLASCFALKSRAMPPPRFEGTVFDRG